MLNLFCAGEKAGQMVGLTEAIVTGVLAGHNAVRRAIGKTCLELPRSLCIGDYIAYALEYMKTEEGQRKRITFQGGRYFNMMKESGVYTTDIPTIQRRVADAGLTGVFAQRII
jgi:folate-dependent tRNA-U54 methylase TrmFO/GidA